MEKKDYFATSIPFAKTQHGLTDRMEFLFESRHVVELTAFGLVTS